VLNEILCGVNRDKFFVWRLGDRADSVAVIIIASHIGKSAMDSGSTPDRRNFFAFSRQPQHFPTFFDDQNVPYIQTHLLMPLQAQGPTGKWCSWTFGYLHRVVNSTAMVNLDGAHHQQGPWADIHSYNYNNWFILSRTILTVVTASQELYCSTSVQARCMYGW
jgi:hypothetical protein